jgi:hypothetical protein
MQSLTQTFSLTFSLLLRLQIASLLSVLRQTARDTSQVILFFDTRNNETLNACTVGILHHTLAARVAFNVMIDWCFWRSPALVVVAGCASLN